LLLRKRNTIFAVAVEKLHKAFHFCVLEHFMSVKDLEPRMQLNKTSTFISFITKKQHIHYKVQLLNFVHAICVHNKPVRVSGKHNHIIFISRLNALHCTKLRG
jgi:hypothetical protein